VKRNSITQLFLFSIFVANSFLFSGDVKLEWHLYFNEVNESSYGQAITTDEDGFIYVSGSSTSSWGDPIHPHSGGSDLAVTKLSQDGSIVWNTFIESGISTAYGISLDHSGNILITGYSKYPWGSPVLSHSGNGDTYVAKLSSRGYLLWNTFLGGNKTNYFTDIQADQEGNIYVCNPSLQCVTRLSPDGKHVWNTSTLASGNISITGKGITIDLEGNLYVVGNSTSYYDGIHLFKINKEGVILWNTELTGGRGNDHGESITLDNDGNICIVGKTWWDTPVNTSGYYPDIIVAKFSPDGELTWRKYVGGVRAERGTGIITDKLGNIYISGGSEITWGEPFDPHEDLIGWDMVIIKLSKEGEYQWHSFFGGLRNDFAEDIAIDHNNNLYVVGSSSENWGKPLKITNGTNGFTVLKISQEE